MISVETSVISCPLYQPFVIANKRYETTECVRVHLTDARGRTGRGEAIGVDYRGETPETICAQIEAACANLTSAPATTDLFAMLPTGGARNALDCALWDLNAKVTGEPVWRLAGLPGFAHKATAYTLGMMDDGELRAMAREFRNFQTLKVKTDSSRGLDPIRIVHEVAPRARLIIDPNRDWQAADLKRYAAALPDLGVCLLEQPVEPSDDECLRHIRLASPVAADEAFFDRDDIPSLVGKYQVLNIKLDKTGGLTEALACVELGRCLGFRLMIGCMMGSSLSMAPAMMIAQNCEFIDLDGPLLQRDDVEYGLSYDQNGVISPPTPELWG
jgi:L-Ala-D/L-Glu epimerase